jgi:hypothetical protein
MRTMLLLTAAFTAMSAAASAEPRTITRIIERPNFVIERVATFDRTARTLEATATATRASDGAVATSSLQRSPIESGFTMSGTATGFSGATLSFASTTTRTTTGTSTTGSITGPAGESFGLLGSTTRIEGGFERSLAITNPAGETVFSRTVTQTGRAPTKRPRGF